MTPDRSYRERFGFQVLIVWFLICSLLIPLGTFYAVHQLAGVEAAQTRGLSGHTVTLAKLVSIENETLALTKELKSGHVDTEHELAGIQSLLNFVATVQKESKQPNPVIAQVEAELADICGSISGCHFTP